MGFIAVLACSKEFLQIMELIQRTRHHAQFANRLAGHFKRGCATANDSYKPVRISACTEFLGRILVTFFIIKKHLKV